MIETRKELEAETERINAETIALLRKGTGGGRMSAKWEPNKRCAECGMDCGNRYHPYEFCILYKAGVDPEAFVRRAAKNVGKLVRDIAYARASPLEETTDE